MPQLPTDTALRLLFAVVFVCSYMALVILHLLNLQKMLMKLSSAGSHETNIMSSTVSFLNLTAINIICALDGITFPYLLKRTIGIL